MLAESKTIKPTFFFLMRFLFVLCACVRVCKHVCACVSVCVPPELFF